MRDKKYDFERWKNIRGELDKGDCDRQCSLFSLQSWVYIPESYARNCTDMWRKI
jgi:hypothetical protein